MNKIKVPLKAENSVCNECDTNDDCILNTSMKVDCESICGTYNKGLTSGLTYHKAILKGIKEDIERYKDQLITIHSEHAPVFVKVIGVDVLDKIINAEIKKVEGEQCRY